MNINFRSDVLPIIVLVAVVVGSAFGYAMWSREEVAFQNMVTFSGGGGAGSVYAAGNTVVKSDYGVDIDGKVYLFLYNNSGTPRITGPAQAASIRSTSPYAQFSTEGAGEISGYLEETPYSFVAVVWSDGRSTVYYPSDLPSGSDGVEVTEHSITFWIDYEHDDCQLDAGGQMWRCQITLAEDGVSGPVAFVYVKK